MFKSYSYSYEKDSHMLTYDRKRWIVDASRADILFERMFGYEMVRRKSFSQFIFFGMLPTISAITMILVLNMFVLQPMPGGPPLGAYIALSFCGFVITTLLVLGVMFWRLERRPYRERTAARMFELQLILLPEVATNRKLLWRHRKEISNYLLNFSNDSTLEMGTSFRWRRQQLERRDKAKMEAYDLLASMGISVSRIVERIEQSLAQLREDEIEAVNRYIDTYQPGSALYYFYGWRFGNPNEYLEELKKAKIVIENPAHPLILEM